MSVRLYVMTWGAFLLAALLLFATGNLTMIAGVVLGFVVFGLVFMGMMNVLPLAVAHPAPMKPTTPEPVAIQRMTETPAKAFGVLKSA